MDWKDEEYLQKVDKLSEDTMHLISQMSTIEEITKTVDIIMTMETEEEIMSKLLQLKNSNNTP